MYLHQDKSSLNAKSFQESTFDHIYGIGIS